MIRKRLSALAAALLLAVGTVLATAAPASAAGSETDYSVEYDLSDATMTCLNLTYVSACVQPYGDILWLKDKRVDGHSVYLYWDDVDGDRYGTCVDDNGVDAGWTRCNKNLSEGHGISWKVGYHNGGGDFVKANGAITTV